MATIREIAKRVGFSQATVSRVLKDDPTFSVKDSTREKILNASLEMGYKNVPQYQRITIPQDVAILDNVVPDKGLQDAYFDELREVLVKHAEEQRMNVTMHEDVDSLINHKTLHRLHKKLPHGVFIDINPAPALFDSVQPDLEQTILDAIDALMGSGCSRIGFIGGLGNIMGKHEYPEDIRTFAFRNWALRLGLDVQGLVYADGPFTVENGRLQGRQLVQDHADDLPDAVIVAADPLAVGVLQAFATENVMVPRDIKVISINNQEIAKYTSPALSSYDISQDELAKAAVLMLAEALTANRKISQHMRISTSLVARDSFTPQD